jgi:hypothetical protein
MKKQTLILALMLVFTFSVTILAGDTQTNGVASHASEGLAGVICQICDALTGASHP